MTDPAIHDHYEQNLLQMLAATVRTVGSVVAGNAEIVLHDLRKPEYSIAEIANAHVTGRSKGDSVLAGMRTDKAFISALEESDEKVTLLLDYETFSRTGVPLRSSTAIYRNLSGKPFAALCINVDNAGITQAIALLQALSGTEVHNPSYAAQHPLEPEPVPGNIEDLMKDIISTATELSPGSRRADAKQAKLIAVQKMQERGIFLIKGGVEKAAAALGVTRYTIYNYLDELKKESEGKEHD
ncbi:helix-turn-helix transcriptional regulator [Erwinia sp.]|uniref:helix-turn-helix transcriptional regulator n=1 Tax=Erwinia citreus TaxID=558 RepID=UPI003C73450D